MMLSFPITIFTLASVVAITISGPALAQPVTVKGASERETELFVASIGMAFRYANIQLQLDGQQPLYCAPENRGLQLSELQSRINNELVGPHEPSMIMIALMQVLKKEFPC
jgi:hypothetical protein